MLGPMGQVQITRVLVHHEHTETKGSGQAEKYGGSIISRVTLRTYRSMSSHHALIKIADCLLHFRQFRTEVARVR
jgi:hypothetical protein